MLELLQKTDAISVKSKAPLSLYAKYQPLNRVDTNLN